MKTLTAFNILVLLLFLLGCDPTGPEEEEAPEIDLAAESITFDVADISNFEGTATITGTVKSIGDDFISDPGQQVVNLYEKPLGGSQKLVAQKEFNRLNGGDSLKVSYSRNWDASSPAEGEFPPDYILLISYGPDISIDDKETNDDSDSANNRLERSGSGINEMF